MKNNSIESEEPRPIFLSPSSSLGGAERVLISLLGPWVRKEACGNPLVVCMEDGPLTEELDRHNISWIIQKLSARVRKLGDSPARREGKFTQIMSFLFALPALLFSFWEMRKFLNSKKPNWIHSNGFKTHLLSAWSAPSGTPIFWHLHDFLGERPLMRRFLKESWRPGIQALAISKAVADDFSKHLPDCPVKVWFNTIDCDIFKPRILEGDWLDSEAGFPGNFRGLRVGLVATYARWKGQDVFLQACHLLKKRISSGLRFYLIGGPVYKTSGSQWSESELKKLIRDLNLYESVGIVPFQKDISVVYNSLDIVVHASTRPEPFGLVIAEAMACGRPVIAALHGGASEVGEESISCVGHEPGNPVCLAAKIESLISNQNLRNFIGVNARNRIISVFSNEKVLVNWHGLFRGG